MTDQDKLTMLKADLQMLTSANDNYLLTLLGIAQAAMTREGIANDDSADYYGCQISYAAYLFRKRAASVGAGETAMPRFLRYQLNNLVLSQKMREG